jgi:SAM-dependent methyltransferase
MERGKIDTFGSYLEEKGLYSSYRRFGRYVRFVFDGYDFSGRKMLDIGCGKGLFPVYACCAGAVSAVGVDPEAAGSTSKSGLKFESMIKDLKLEDRVTFLKTVFQEAKLEKGSFDIVLMKASVNHLDEEACTILHKETWARERYVDIFKKIADLMRPGAKIVMTDSSPANLFGRLFDYNPLIPTVEWEKHQKPELWGKLLRESGFSDVRIRWIPPNRLWFLRGLLATRAAAYATTSLFCLDAARI